MELTKIVFIDLDEDYLMTLVLKFINKLHDNIDITMITDSLYLQEYMEQPHDIDLLVINEKLYTQAFDRYNIDYIYLLSETVDDSVTEPTQGSNIYKYSSVNEIYARIASLSNLEARYSDGNKSTKLVMVYSPIGGSGKTFTAIGIAKALSLLNKRVLYVNLETIQNFNYYFKDKSYLQNKFIYGLTSKGDNFSDILKESIHTEGFEFLPPFEQSITSFNITMDVYFDFLRFVRDQRSYDYVILDTSSEFTSDKAKLMSECDKVFVITKQDVMSVWKFDCFLRNVDLSNTNKFMILCNEYDAYEPNMLSPEDKSVKYNIMDYIKKVPQKAECINTANIAENTSFQRIAYYLL
jgi:cellulose biosynthesis protein BcsQ